MEDKHTYRLRIGDMDRTADGAHQLLGDAVVRMDVILDEKTRFGDSHLVFPSGEGNCGRDTVAFLFGVDEVPNNILPMPQHAHEREHRHPADLTLFTRFQERVDALVDERGYGLVSPSSSTEFLDTMYRPDTLGAILISFDDQQEDLHILGIRPFGPLRKGMTDRPEAFLVYDDALPYRSAPVSGDDIVGLYADCTFYEGGRRAVHIVTYSNSEDGE